MSATIQVRKLGLFFQVWALSRVSVFVCLILKQGQRLRPWAAQQLSEINGSSPPPPRQGKRARTKSDEVACYLQSAENTEK